MASNSMLFSGSSSYGPQAPQRLWPKFFFPPCTHTSWEQKLNYHSFWHSIWKTWNLLYLSFTPVSKQLPYPYPSHKSLLIAFHALVTTLIKAFWNLTNSMLPGWLFSALHNLLEKPLGIFYSGASLIRSPLCSVVPRACSDSHRRYFSIAQGYPLKSPSWSLSQA